jgi:hypothetical protein
MGDTSGGQYIYWLGGFSSSGKTTAADALSAMLGYAVLHRDVAIPDHEHRLQTSNNPLVQGYLKLRREGRFHEFFARAPEQVAAEFMSLIAEDFVLTLEDLEAEPPQVPTILEGARLRADLLFKSFAPQSRVAWLRPTESMFGHSISSRPRLVQLVQKLGPDGLRQLTRVFYLTSELQVEVARNFGVGVVTIEDPTDYSKVPTEVARIWGVTVQ